MNDAERLFHELLRLCPNANTIILPPVTENGFWTIEADHAGNEICVEWSSEGGFRISSSGGFAFGERPDVSLSSFDEAVSRAVEFLEGRSVSAPAYAVSLAELRERLGFTQGQIASALDIKQPTVSGIERRGDIQISSLYRYVSSMGGGVSVKATFPNAQYILRFDAIHSEAGSKPGAGAKRREVEPAQRSAPLGARFTALSATGSLGRANTIARQIKDRGSILELVA